MTRDAGAYFQLGGVGGWGGGARGASLCGKKI